MKRVARRCGTMLLILAVLAGVCPAGYAAALETESLSEEYILKNPLSEDDLDSKGDIPQQEELIDISLTSSAATVSYPVEGGNLYFDMTTGGITDCDTTVTRAAIPSEINGISVTSIEEKAFYNCKNMTSVIIPSSIISIGYDAFYRCTSITSVHITDLTAWCNIDFSAGTSAPLNYSGGNLYLNGKLLSELIIPDSVTSIKFGTFYGCRCLTSVTIPDSVTSIGGSAFEGCSGLTDVTIPVGVTSIGGGAFSGCNYLTSVTIPDSVTSIKSYAFSNCTNLNNITIPDSVISIESNAFNGCTSLTSITIPNSVTSIASGTFSGCKSLISVTIPDSITSIGSSAFEGCTSLTSINIPNSVTSIKENAFQGCISLTSVTIPDNITSIEFGTFYGCRNLTSVIIPDSITSIGGYAFFRCNNLASIMIPDSVTFIGDSAFQDCDSLTSIEIPGSVTFIEEEAFGWCDNLTNVTIGDSVTYIESGAFFLCDNLTSIVFWGDAPEVSSASGYTPFPPKTTLYYFAEKSGWSTPAWHGYKTVAILDANAIWGIHTDAYYSVLQNHNLRFTDHTGKPLAGVTVTVDGQNLQSSTASSLEFAYSGTEPVVISKPGYHTVTLHNYLLDTYNVVALHATGSNVPFVQAAYGSQNGGMDYNNLLHNGMNFYAGSLTEKTSFYIDVNWGTKSEGRIYLSQTLNPKDGIELSQGLNDAQNISMYLKSGGGLYLLMVTGDGVMYTKSLKVSILSEDTDFSIDFGDSIDIPKPGDNFLSKFKLGFDLPENYKASLSIEPDGTVLATLGVKVSEGKSVSTAVKTIKDALYHTDNYPKDWDSFIGALHGSIIPQSSSFGVTLDSKVIGYLEGKLVHNADGSYGILFSEGKVAAILEGKAEHSWQIYAMGAPFYVGASIEPSVEFAIELWSNEKNTELLLDPIQATGKLPIKVRGGLGWDSIASAGIYGKGSLTVEFTIPLSKEELSLYANASFGAEAKFFCFSGDLEIYKTDNFYLYGSPDDTPGAGGRMVLNASTLDWRPQSREYLYEAALMEVGEDDAQTDAQTVASGVYPYADVQLAVLPDGTQLMVWTADPGEATRPEANNRTVLYYAVNTGSGWSAPTPVENVDDGTADFNPLLTVLDGTAYLLWQDASRPLTAGDDVSSTAQVMDISVATFDAAAGTFTSLGSVGTEFYDGAVSAGLTDGQLTVVWASNSGNNPLTANGQVGALHRAVWDGGQFVSETLEENFGAIDQTATDGTSIWLSADTDYDSGTLNDREIFCYHNGLSQCTDNDVADTKPSFRNGSLLWYSGGALVTEDGEAIPLAKDTDRYNYVQSSGGMEAVVYTVTDETRVSALYASFNDGTGWGKPILLNNASGNVGNFSAQFCQDGTLSISTSERTTSEVTGEYEVPKLSSTAQIKVYSVTPMCDLAVSDVTYLPQSLVSGGTLDIQLELENKGMTAVPMATVQVLSGSEILAEQTYSMDLRSGECIGLMVNVPLETVPEQLRVAVTPIGYSDGNEADNSADLNLRLSDVSLEGGTGYSDGTATVATVLVVNRGQTALNDIVLNLYDTNAALLSTQTVSALAIGDSEFVTFALDHPTANNSMLRVEAEKIGSENILGNNSSVLLVSASREKALTLMGNAMDTDSGLAVVATVRNTTDTDQAYSLICASYDKDGRLLHTTVLNDLSTQSGVEDYHQLTLASNDSAKTVKVFLLSSGYAPLTRHVELQLE